MFGTFRIIVELQQSLVHLGSGAGRILSKTAIDPRLFTDHHLKRQWYFVQAGLKLTIESYLEPCSNVASFQTKDRQ